MSLYEGIVKNEIDQKIQEATRILTEAIDLELLLGLQKIKAVIEDDSLDDSLKTREFVRMIERMGKAAEVVNTIIDLWPMDSDI